MLFKLNIKKKLNYAQQNPNSFIIDLMKVGIMKLLGGRDSILWAQTSKKQK